MKNKYIKTIDGVIKQNNPILINYDNKYVIDRYISTPTKDIMSYLRLGFLIGSIGHIPNSIMDVGYGSGAFLEACLTIIPNVYGNDVQPAYPLNDNIKFIEDITSIECEVMTFFDSIEHFEDIEFVSKLKAKYIIISVPWCYNSDDMVWFENWKHRRENEHIYHFNETTLIKFMERHNYKLKHFCNVEDSIRKDPNLNPNILTACFVKE